MHTHFFLARITRINTVLSSRAKRRISGIPTKICLRGCSRDFRLWLNNSSEKWQWVLINIGDDIPVNTKCHSERSEESRGHSRLQPLLCYRDSSSLRSSEWQIVSRSISIPKYILTIISPLLRGVGVCEKHALYIMWMYTNTPPPPSQEGRTLLFYHTFLAPLLFLFVFVYFYPLKTRNYEVKPVHLRLIGLTF